MLHFALLCLPICYVTILSFPIKKKSTGEKATLPFLLVLVVSLYLENTLDLTPSDASIGKLKVQEVTRVVASCTC